MIEEAYADLLAANKETVATEARHQYVWDVTYIDSPILRDENADMDDDDCMDEGAERLYYLWDANRNVTALINNDGAVVEGYVYDPYGRVTIWDDDWSDTVTWASSKANEILFCGYRWDPETGLYHVRHRMYHPTLGRWLQRDPLGYVDGNELYEYGVSNPGDAVDPHGLYTVRTSVRYWASAVSQLVARRWTVVGFTEKKTLGKPKLVWKEDWREHKMAHDFRWSGTLMVDSPAVAKGVKPVGTIEATDYRWQEDLLWRDQRDDEHEGNILPKKDAFERTWTLGRRLILSVGSDVMPDDDIEKVCYRGVAIEVECTWTAGAGVTEKHIAEIAGGRVDLPNEQPALNFVATRFVGERASNYRTIIRSFSIDLDEISKKVSLKEPHFEIEWEKRRRFGGREYRFPTKVKPTLKSFRVLKLFRKGEVHISGTITGQIRTTIFFVPKAE